MMVLTCCYTVLEFQTIILLNVWEHSYIIIYIYTIYMICPYYLYGNPILIPWLSPMRKQTLKEINQPTLLDTDHLPYYRSGKARIVVLRFWISLGWIWNKTISYNLYPICQYEYPIHNPTHWTNTFEKLPEAHTWVEQDASCGHRKIKLQ